MLLVAIKFPAANNWFENVAGPNDTNKLHNVKTSFV